MKKKPNFNNGCLYFVYLIFNIISLMWILAGVVTYKKIYSRFFLLTNSDQIELKTFYIESFITKGVGGKSGGGILYIFKGNIDQEEGQFKASVESNLELDYHSIHKIIEKNEMDIWFLMKDGHVYKHLQKVYPTKNDLISHYEMSLFLTFFIPLFMLIRLIVLYKLGRFDFPEKTENLDSSNN